MNRSFGILRIILRYLGRGIAVLLILLAIAIGFVGFTDAGARLAVSYIEKLAAASGHVVSVAGPSGLLTGRLRAETITVADANGAYAEINDLAVDWKPLDLLFLSFNAERISASSVSLLRLPETQAQSGDTGGSFSLPVEVHVGSLDVPELFIGAAVGGRDQRLALTGNGDATAESVAAKLSVVEKERPDAKVAADIVFNPAGNELRLEADINEPQGGIIAGLLKLPGSPAVSLRLTGDGPLSQWEGRLSAALDGEERLRLDGRHDLSTAGVHTIALTGGGTFDALMPPQLRPIFAGETGIDIVAAFDGSDTIRIERGNIATGAIRLDASGAVSATGQNDLDVRLTGTDGAVDFRWPLAGGDLRALIEGADISLVGSATSAALQVNASIASLDMPAGRVENIRFAATSDAFNVAERSGRVEATLETGATALASPDIDRLIRGPVKVVGTLDVSPSRIGFDPVTIESASIGGTVSGTHDLPTGQTEAAFRVFALPAVLPEALAGKFDTTIATAGRLSLAGSGAVEVSNLTVTSGTIEASGSVSLADGSLRSEISGSLPDIGKLLADATGQAAFELSATGPVDGLDVSARVTSSGATLAGRTLSDLVMTVEGKAVADAPSGQLTATGALDGQAINIRSTVASEGGRVSIPVIEAEIGPNTLQGSLALGANLMPDGTIAFTFPDLSLLAAMAGERASGDLSGRVELATTDGRTSATVNASGSGIQRDTLSIVSPAVDIAIGDLSTATITGTVTAERVSSGENRVEALTLGFTRSGTSTVYDLTGRLDGAPLRSNGRIDQSGDSIDVALQALEAAPRGIALRLARPTTIAVAGGAARLDGLVIDAGQGSVSVSGRAGENLDLSLRLNALPAALVNNFAAGLDAEGAIGGTVTVRGTAAAPVVDYALDWSGARTSHTRSAGVGALDIRANGQFANNTVRLDTTLSGGGLSFSGGGTVGITGQTPLSLRFSGTVPFSLLQGQLSGQGFQLTGNAAVDVSISGTAGNPVIGGTITSSGARLVDVRRNLAVENLTLRVNLEGGQAVIQEFSGRLASGGQLSASGRVGIQPGSGFPVDVTIRLADITYVDGALVTANVTGDLTVKGPALGGVVLGGNIRLNKANITIPQKLPASLSEIDIKHRNESADVRRMTADVTRDQGTSGEARGVGLDLILDAPGQVFVRGRGINAELGGRLTITGTTSAPSVSGGFQLVRGRMDILNRRLDFQSANIGFSGGLVPIVNLVAGTSAGSTEITVTVSGQANNPTVIFASSPSLPQDEILAQLIFNQSMSNLSALQIAQLASAASELAGGRSTGLLSSLRSQLGVDDLDITTDSEGRAQVSAGKYLNDRTYLELKQDPESSGAKAVINLDVGRGIKLRGEAGSGGSAGAGIFYEKEY